MWETIRSLTVSELAAWYAAFISTLALGWEIVKYIQQGIELEVSARGNMVLAGAGHPGHGKKHVLVSVKHVSGPRTTITHVGIRKFESRWHKFISYDSPSWLQTVFRKIGLSEGHQPAILPGNPQCEYPAELEIGNEWKCYFDQNELYHLAGGDLIYIFVMHTMRDNEELVRLERHQ